MANPAAVLERFGSLYIIQKIIFLGDGFQSAFKFLCNKKKKRLASNGIRTRSQGCRRPATNSTHLCPQVHTTLGSSTP